MKAKRALCMLAAILLVVAMMLMFLTGCNRQVLAKNPLFLVTYIYFLHFFFTLIKEKSGKVGRKPAKPCVPTVSACPLFK